MKEVFGVDEVPESQVPEDSYTKSRQFLDKTRTGGEDDWGKFRSKKNETKIFGVNSPLFTKKNINSLQKE